MYPSMEETAAIISVVRYPPIIDDFSGLLASWRMRFESIAKPSDFAKYIDIIAHSSQAWLYSVALQAFLRRCRISTRRAHSSDHTNDATMTSLQECMQSERSRADLEIIDKMVCESKLTLELILELHHEGSLRHAPLNIMTDIANASTLLLRVQYLPLHAIDGLFALLEKVATALEEASVDDAHAFSQFASCLRRLNSYARAETGKDHQASDSVDPALQASIPEASSLEPDPTAWNELEGLDHAMMSFSHVPFPPLFDDQFIEFT
ncbi:hypothetical protein B0J12DRAFT_700992 [Macrophomina phaseolina]|uniref:Uncharacterized protein n=1 Tax=Macrophomina phaseolina TaxID=35725 RepID=A0ABQ8G5V4_9PEZI|nr:hypothetical protein B0J12DRAFT_700992 [Macrophomina phaseolina]